MPKPAGGSRPARVYERAKEPGLKIPGLLKEERGAVLVDLALQLADGQVQYRRARVQLKFFGQLIQECDVIVGKREMEIHPAYTSTQCAPFPR